MEKEKEAATDITVQPDRKMAFVAKIESLDPIENADELMLATVLGWKVVVNN